MIQKLFHTIIHLRLIQIHFQLWYRFRKLWRTNTGFKYSLSIPKEGNLLTFSPWIEKQEVLKGNTFTFLNKSLSFQSNNINWNFEGYGKLWIYNLNYFDFLIQKEMNLEKGLFFIKDFIFELNSQSGALEAYPIALRGINWIKFISKHQITAIPSKQVSNIDQINSSLFAQYQILLDNLEYHLLGNHLLEDAFSLLFGAFYFNDNKLYLKAKDIITIEMEEQILDDGAHFELSPMYHKIILDRLLDCINLIQSNDVFPDQVVLLELMREKAGTMLSWLNAITFANGEIPMLNDSAPGISAPTQQLNKYAQTLNFELRTQNSELSDSGYRKFTSLNYECIVDVGALGPSYQPGHAHADTLNFVLNVNNNPVLVDTGISTYEANKTRLSERGTAAHNTITVQNKNSSEVWSSFRVAQRARVKILTDTNKKITAEHNGYQHYGFNHRRSFQFRENEIIVQDSIIGSKNAFGENNLHFHPSAKVVLKKNGLQVEDNIFIKFEGHQKFILVDYQLPIGYNQYKSAKKSMISFNSTMQIKITIYED